MGQCGKYNVKRMECFSHLIPRALGELAPASLPYLSGPERKGEALGMPGCCWAREPRHSQPCSPKRSFFGLSWTARSLVQDIRSRKGSSQVFLPHLSHPLLLAPSLERLAKHQIRKGEFGGEHGGRERPWAKWTRKRNLMD